MAQKIERQELLNIFNFSIFKNGFYDFSVIHSTTIIFSL